MHNPKPKETACTEEDHKREKRERSVDEGGLRPKKRGGNGSASAAFSGEGGEGKGETLLIVVDN